MENLIQEIKEAKENHGIKKYNNRFLKLAGWAQHTYGNDREENTLNLRTENSNSPNPNNREKKYKNTKGLKELSGNNKDPIHIIKVPERRQS